MLEGEGLDKISSQWKERGGPRQPRGVLPTMQREASGEGLDTAGRKSEGVRDGDAKGGGCEEEGWWG